MNLENMEKVNIEVPVIHQKDVLENPPDLSLDGAVTTKGIQYGEERLVDPKTGTSVKNGMTYSLYATAIVSLFITVFFHGKLGWTAEEIGIIYSAGVPIVNGILVVGKKLLDKYLV